MRSPLFLALTRPVSFAGLPMAHVVMLAMLSVGGFVASGSFVWLGASALVGYLVLRGIAAQDPHLIDVWLTSLQRTPPTPSWLMGRGVSYDA